MVVMHVPPLQPIPLEDAAWEKIDIDTIGPFDNAPSDSRYTITLLP